jgi:hypothetical protein
MHKLRNCIALPDDLRDNHCACCLLSQPKITVNAWDDLSDDTNVLALRASTLLHVSCPIGRPMQCHIRFFYDVEERE